MRNFINIITEANEPRSLDSHLDTLTEWLCGDAMSLINDDGERFSPVPYYDAIMAISKVVPPTNRSALSGKIYRGVQFTNEIDIQPGRLTTSKKRFQSWTPKAAVAKEFATQYTGSFGVVFEADASACRRQIVLAMSDVLAWLRTSPDGVSPETLKQALYTFEGYEHQDEVILRGSIVEVQAIKVVKWPRKVKMQEARITDGALTSVTANDLQRLVTSADYRGCAVAGKVYLWKAHDNTHHGFRRSIGLPSFSHAGGGDENDGFNFFCAPSAAYYETEQGDDEARDDWVISKENFTVGTAAVWVDAEPNIVLQNRQFARMVGRPVIEPPQG